MRFVLLFPTLALSILPPLLLPSPVAAADKKQPVTFAPSQGIAIHGYDPVAYFEQGKPVIGDARFAFDWNGATWHFATSAHRDAFIKDPNQFAPAYGGWCAYGLSRGYQAPTKPEAWSIVDGRLFLNYDLKIRDEWTKRKVDYIRQADANWPKLRGGQ